MTRIRRLLDIDPWADHESGGVIVVAVAGDPSDFEDLARTEARRELPELEPLIRMKQVEVPIADLEQTWAQFKEDVEEWDALGAEFSVVGLYNDRNRIVVGMVNPDHPVTELMRARYGADRLVFEERARPRFGTHLCRSILDCDSMRGGIEIVKPNGGYCSAGFGAVDRNSSAVGIITAGHCGLVGADWRHAGRFYGTVGRHDNKHALTDSAWVPRTGGFPDRPGGDEVYSNNSQTIDVSGRYLGTNISDHRILCNVGSRSVGPECHNTANGDVWIEGNDPNYGWRRLWNQIEVVGCGVPGDSGGPIYGHVPTNGSAYAVATFVAFKWGGPSVCQSQAYIYGSYIVHTQNHLGVDVRT